MKKTTKRKPAKRADNKSISYRLTDDEFGPVERALAIENSGPRPKVKMAAYAKHALIVHPGLNRIAAELVAFRNSVAERPGERRDLGWLVEQLGNILGGAS